MAKPNYNVAKRQKELARKARKREKLERKSARADDLPSKDDAGPAGGAAEK